MKQLLILLLVGLMAPVAAFADDNGASHIPQLGVFAGRALPHGISSADDIFTLWGVRYSQPFGKTDKGGGGSFVDFGFIGGNGSDVHWGGLSLDVSLQAPFETLIGSVGVGLDVTQFSSDTKSTRVVFGEHFLGSIMSRIGGESYLRFDMKFNAQPGTTVFFGLGIVFGFGGDNAGGGT